jgi:hypothetical protein
MSGNDFAGPTAAVLRAISDPGSILPRLQLHDGGLETLPEWQTRAVLQAAAPVLVADCLKSAVREQFEGAIAAAADEATGARLAAIEAAARASERESIRQLADDREATAWNAPLDANECSRVPFADLIGDAL